MLIILSGGEDFVPLVSNITQPFNPEGMQCTVITLLNDTVFEDDEWFTLTVVVGSDDAFSFEPFSNNVTITILDNDGT